MEEILKKEIQFDGFALKESLRHESLVLDMMKRIGIVSLREQTFLLDKIKELPGAVAEGGLKN